MKQQMWLLNSSLLVLLLIAWIVSLLLYIESPLVKKNGFATIASASMIQESLLAPDHFDAIFTYDLFGAVVVSKQTGLGPKSFVTPVPEQPPIEEEEPPVPPKQEFIDPLPLTVKGIILSSDETHDVAMIEDETKKESLYHLGDAIKDGTIIKIVRDRVVILRTNGQQEIFFLRKDDVPRDMSSEAAWVNVVKKIDDHTFAIDRENFLKVVPSLGNFIERTSIIGTIYENGKPLGIRIGQLDPHEVGAMLGLKIGDIIVSINGVSVVEERNRLQIFEQIKTMSRGDQLMVRSIRDKKEETFTYKFATLQKAKEKTFTGDGNKAGEKKPDQALKMSKTQQREKQVRDFKKQHAENAQQQEAASKIRQRILDNLRSRMQNTRVR